MSIAAVPTQYVYLIGVLDGCHKIGRSTNPDRRLADFGPHLPVPLSVTHRIVTADMGWLESYLHAAFIHRRVRGEWFRLSEEEVGLITAVPAADAESDLPPAIVALHRQSLERRLARTCVTLPRGMADILADVAAEQGWTRSRLMEEVAADYLRVRGKWPPPPEPEEAPRPKKGKGK